jgi:hypothetical protein
MHMLLLADDPLSDFPQHRRNKQPAIRLYVGTRLSDFGVASDTRLRRQPGKYLCRAIVVIQQPTQSFSPLDSSFRVDRWFRRKDQPVFQPLMTLGTDRGIGLLHH